MEIDDGVVMAQSHGSASVPSASVSDKEDSVNNFNELPRLHYSLAITIDRSVLDYTLSSDISIALVFSVPGISSCGSISNSIAYMLSPTIANISATTTVAATAAAAAVEKASQRSKLKSWHKGIPTGIDVIIYKSSFLLIGKLIVHT